MKKQAFNLSEILMALVILGVLISLTITNGRKQLPNMDKLKLKKAYITVEKTVNGMLDDDTFYPTDAALADLSIVTTEFGESFGFPNKESKFRDIFKYQVSVTKDNISCPTWVSTNDTTCFKTADGIVYGIPDTDFKTRNTITKTVKRINDTIDKKYVPITIYTNWEKYSNEPDKAEVLKNQAFFIGVSYNGEIILLTQTGVCSDNLNSKEFQCKAKKYLTSTSYRKDD